MRRLPNSALALSTLLAAGLLSACTTPAEEPSATLDLPEELFNYADPDFPDHFSVESEGWHAQQPLLNDDNTPDDNPTTDAGATLGRVLFYDVDLSQNHTVACSTCHEPENGFSDDEVLSPGFDGGETRRHSMGLTNARFYREGRFFWDQRADTLEDQVLMPFQDSVEMGMTLDEVVARVNERADYADLFDAAFGDSDVTSDRISRALAQFVRSMVSTTSPYDEGRAQVDARFDPFPNFSDRENLGKALFVRRPPEGGMGCFVCHQGEGFIAVEATNNGLDADSDDDGGYGEVTENSSDEGTFKVPSLRNVALRAPYMHDGRFETLEEVIDHYSDGVVSHPNMDPPLGPPGSGAPNTGMSDSEKAALVAFLETLTDEEMVEDRKFSDPFVR
ncbi:MAG: c-type cytochrome [Deltaproteobacteria bacterium]|nr:c-type cytochrome [Deltaproteobacteria bacterium]